MDRRIIRKHCNEKASEEVQMSKPREWWIFKGTSEFCSELEWNEDYSAQDVKIEPEGFYDVVCIEDMIVGGIHVIEYSEYERLLKENEHLKNVIYLAGIGMERK